MTQIDHQYFEWLVSQVGVPRNKTFNGLFERMHNLEFIWFIPNDDNRVQDGLDLRIQFANGTDKPLNLNGVTILEVLIGLSRRVAFTAGGTAENWAWRLIKNLRLHKYPDPLGDRQAGLIDDILYALVWRTYDPDGWGGFFPLKNPIENQTEVEIWYQMNAYVIEMKQKENTFS